MRHFGHGVGHLQYERQHEIEPDHDNGMTPEDVSDQTDNPDTGDSDPLAEESEIVHDSDEEEESYNGTAVTVTVTQVTSHGHNFCIFVDTERARRTMK